MTVPFANLLRQPVVQVVTAPIDSVAGQLQASIESLKSRGVTALARLPRDQNGLCPLSFIVSLFIHFLLKHTVRSLFQSLLD